MVFAVAIASAAGDERAVAEAALRDVAASPHHDAAKEPAERAKAALDRGSHLRAAGDEAHAKLADRLARTWAETALDVTRAAAVEASAAKARIDALDAGAITERERALLEEAIARGGRLRAQLEAGDAGMKDPPKTSAQAKDLDAGKPAPRTPSRDAGAPADRGGGR
jgi:hypothetical protein